MASAIKICDATVHRGEKTALALPLPELFSCSPMYMPIKVVGGAEKGPCLLVFAMLEGNEFNGLEIANRLYDSLDPQDVKGTLITVPALNVYGLVHGQRGAGGGAGMESAFPGNVHGDFNERVAHVFTQEVLSKCEYAIDLKTGSLNHETYPQVYCNLSRPGLRELATEFHAPVVTSVENTSSNLRRVTEELGIQLLVYEAGEALRFSAGAIQLGLDGVLRLMGKIGMLSNSAGSVADPTPVFSKDEAWLTSHASGVLHPTVSLGKRVKKGELIAALADPFSSEKYSSVKSHLDGIIVGINRSPLIQEGERLFKIASFINNARAVEMLEGWDDAKPESAKDE